MNTDTETLVQVAAVSLMCGMVMGGCLVVLWRMIADSMWERIEKLERARRERFKQVEGKYVSGSSPRQPSQTACRESPSSVRQARSSPASQG